MTEKPSDDPRGQDDPRPDDKEKHPLDGSVPEDQTAGNSNDHPAGDQPQNTEEPSARAEDECPGTNAAESPATGKEAGGDEDEEMDDEAYLLRDLHLVLPEGTRTISPTFMKLLVTVEILQLSASLEELPERFGEKAWSLRWVEVPYSNPYFRSIDGVLYSKDGKKLLFYPPGKKARSFTVPETVEIVGRSAFACCTHLETIHLGASVRVFEPLMEPMSAEEESFQGLHRLKSFDVDPANPRFCSIDGVLYQDDARTLVCYPPAKKGSDVKIRDSVEVIAPFALAKNRFFDQVIFPNSVREIGEGAFFECRNLSRLCLSDSLLVIGKQAFARCNLTVLRIPKGVQVFDRCVDEISCLERIDVDPENQYLRSSCGILFSKDLSRLIRCPEYWPRKSIVIPDQVTTIETGAFEEGVYIQSIKVPSTVRIIKDDAFIRSPVFESQTIYAEQGSAAWWYAKENHLRVADISDFPEEDFLD